MYFKVGFPLHAKRRKTIWVTFFLITLVIALCVSWLLYRYKGFYSPIDKGLLCTALVGVVLLILVSFAGSLSSAITYDNILANFNRSRIYYLIKENPGVHFNEIINELQLSRGQAQWHLTWLLRFDLIKRKRAKQFLIFYLNDGSLSEGLNSITHTIVLKSEIRKQILELIQEEPGITQKKIIMKIQKSQSTITYHLVVLENEEFIEIRRKGRKNYYFLKNGILT